MPLRVLTTTLDCKNYFFDARGRPGRRPDGGVGFSNVGHRAGERSGGEAECLRFTFFLFFLLHSSLSLCALRL